MDVPALEIESLSYRYPDGTAAVKGVDLRIEPGSKVGMVGPNGAGKSTLMLCVDGFLAFDGAIRVAGVSVKKANLKAIRSQVGLVFQQPDDQLFMPRLFDDIAFGPINQQLSAEAVRTRVAQSLAAVGLTGFDDRAPHHLSMGQKRNAAIAAVLAMQPSVLLLDEPSANLDPRSRRQLIRLLREMDIPMLIASHDLEMVVAVAELTVVLDDGRIMAEGPTRDVLANADLMDTHGLEVPASLADRDGDR